MHERCDYSASRTRILLFFRHPYRIWLRGRLQIGASRVLVVISYVGGVLLPFSRQFCGRYLLSYLTGQITVPYSAEQYTNCISRGVERHATTTKAK